MRYSEAVKRYKFETKQRILSNILEAAEKETADASPIDNYGSDPETKEKETDTEKRMITMKATEMIEVRSRKGAAIAAACAALVIGSSVALFANSDKLQKDNSSVAVTNSNPSALTVLNSGKADEDSTPTDTDESVSQDENSAADDTSSVSDKESSADDSSSKNNKKNDSSASTNDTTSKNTTVTPNNTTSSATDNKKTAAADPDVKASFDELLGSTDYVILGQIVSAEPTTITNRDGSTQYCIAYEIYHEFNYVKNTKQLYFIGDWNTTIYQPVAEGSKPTLTYGDQAVFMAYDSGNYGMVKTASNGVFAPGKNDLKSVSSGTDSINNAMTDYILNTVLYGRDSANVESWISMLYGNDSYYSIDDIYDENYPSEVTFVSWDGSKFALHENTNPTWNKICNMLYNEETKDFYHYFETDYPVYSNDDPIFVSDCDDLDVALNGMFINTKTNAISFDFTIMPKAGSRITLNDGVFYDLKANSNKILSDMGKYFNADSIIITKGSKFSLYPDNCIGFTIMLYQSEPNGKLSLDLDRNFSFTLGGIYNTDGSALYDSQIKIDFNVDTRILTEIGENEVNIVTSETAASKSVD